MRPAHQEKSGTGFRPPGGSTIYCDGGDVNCAGVDGAMLRPYAASLHKGRRHCSYVVVINARGVEVGGLFLRPYQQRQGNQTDVDHIVAERRPFGQPPGIKPPFWNGSCTWLFRTSPPNTPRRLNLAYQPGGPVAWSGQP